MQEWEILEEVHLHANEGFHHVQLRTYKLPNGQVIRDHLHVVHPNWVNVIAFDPGGSLIMIEQYRPAINRTVLELPGGIVGEKEDSLFAALRELHEEAGFVGDRKFTRLFMTAAVNPSTHVNACYTYVVERTTYSKKSPDLKEDLKIVQIPFNRLQEMLVNDSWDVVSALSLAPLWKYLAIRGI